MAEVIVATAAKVQAVENASIVGGSINEAGELILEKGDDSTLNVGSVAGTTPDATTTSKGIVELATGAEAATGTDNARAVTPLALSTVVSAIVSGTQPVDADLTTIAGLTHANDTVLQTKAGAWAARTPAQLAADLVTTAPFSGVVVLTDAATIATDASLGTHFKVTLAGNRTLGVPTNPRDGQKATWEIIQDATGSRTLTLAGGTGGFAFGTDITGITLTTTASKRDFIGAIYNAAAQKWFVVAFAKGY